MKTQISRRNQNGNKRYSGVYQQQGRMILDADWNENVDISKEALARALRALVMSGSPADFGFIRSKGTYQTPDAELKWGDVIVKGIPAVVSPASGDFSSDFHYGEQEGYKDAPLPPGPVGEYGFPGAGEYYVYLDVWDRSLTFLEDEDLRDPALHGADTATRTQTMAQVKICPSSVKPDDPAMNPPKGNGLITLHLREGATEPDLCDPCSRETILEDTHENYLFRVEVHHVKRTPQGEINELVLKWSGENGAEQYEQNNVPPGFKKASYCFELFSGTGDGFASEKSSGRHFVTDANWPKTYTPYIHSDYPPMVDATQLIRRWDGFIILKKTPGGWVLDGGEDRGVQLSTGKSPNEHAYVYMGSGYPEKYAEDYLGLSPQEIVEDTPVPKVVLNLNTTILELRLEDGAGNTLNFLTGDYWSIPVRGKDEEINDPLELNGPPHGIDHYYYHVARIKDGVFNWEASLWEESPGGSGFKARRHPFPFLGRVTAGDVAYAPARCPNLETRSMARLLTDQGVDDFVIGQREVTVKRFLNLILCRLHASHLPVDRGDLGLCLYEDEGAEPPVLSVQDGLNKLCNDIKNLTGADIAYTLPVCAPTAGVLKTVKELLGELFPGWHNEGSVKSALDALLCLLDARSMPLFKDNNLCEELRSDANVATVQDAINALCARGRTGCSSYTILPEPGWEQIFNLLSENEDANICFQAGYYEIKETITVAKGGHLKITGAGDATRIRVTGRECAIHFEGCKSVAVSDLFMDSLTVAPYNQPSLMGVITVTDSEKVAIRRVTLKCAAGTRLNANCLTIRSNKPRHSVRVEGCDFTTGHYQGGLLVINASRAMIRDNTVKVAPRPSFLTFEKIVADPKRLGVLRRQLTDRVLADYDHSVSKATTEKGNIAIRVGPQKVLFKSSVSEAAWKEVIRNNPPGESDYETAEAANNYIKGIINGIVKQPPQNSEFERRVDSFKASIGEANFNTVTANPSVKEDMLKNLFVASEPVVETDAGLGRETGFKLGEFRIGFDSVIGQSEWTKIVSDSPPTVKNSTGALKIYFKNLADKLLTDKALRDKYTGLKTWFDHMKNNNPAAGSQGIVCAGKKATDIKILDNNISGVFEGIRVAVSHGGYYTPGGSGLQSDSVTISGNRLSLRKPATLPRAARAVFIGNCKSLIVENNRMTVSGKSATLRLFYEGIRVYGSMGRVVLIRQNSFANCLTGILFHPLGLSEGDWEENLWIISDNIAPGAEKAVTPNTVKGYDTNLT